MSRAEQKEIANRFNDFLKDCETLKKPTVIWNSELSSWMFLNYNIKEKKLNIFSSDINFDLSKLNRDDKLIITDHFKEVMKLTSKQTVMGKATFYINTFQPENPKNRFAYALAYGLHLAMGKSIFKSEWQPNETEDTAFIANIIAQVLHHRKLPRPDIWEHLSDSNIFE